MKIFICTSVMFICIISYVDYYFPVVCKDKATFTCKHVGLVLHKDPEENTKHLLIFLIYGKLNYWDFCFPAAAATTVPWKVSVL